MNESHKIVKSILSKLDNNSILHRRYLEIILVAMDLPLNRRQGYTLAGAVWKEYDEALSPLDQWDKWYSVNSLTRTIVELDLIYYIEDNKLDFQKVFGK